MTRYDIINQLIKKYDYKTYLEIGVQNKVAFNKVECNIKICVDPNVNAKANYVMTSDEYFNSNKSKFDIIFIDGLHEANQVERDINNSLDCLSENGSIVVHDCNPQECVHQIVPRISKVWNGDVWKAWVNFRNKNYLDMFVVNTDYGCGIIRKDKNKENSKNIQKYESKTQFTWEGLIKNRDQWLNLISITDFKQWLLLR